MLNDTNSNYIQLTITRDGSYDFKENLKYKVRAIVQKEIAAIDYFFTKPL